MSCSTRPAYVRPTRAWPAISSLRSSNGSSYQFAPAVAALRHRVEADHAASPAGAGAGGARGSARCARATTASRASSSAPVDALLGCEAGALVVLGRGVLRLLGERHVRVRSARAAPTAARSGTVQPGEVGPERHHAEVGLVAEHGEDERLVPVGLERRDASTTCFAGAGVALGPLAVDPVEEVQDAPTDRRRHRRP